MFLECDVVHLHLIHNNFFNIEHLPLISYIKPVVWTLHDPWALTGHCIHPLDCQQWKTGCEICPDLHREFSIKQDTTAINWENKRIIFQSCDMDIIVASQWMYDKVNQSKFFINSNLHLVNFGLDLTQYKVSRDIIAAKKKLGIPPQNLVIAFRSTSSIYKGFTYVKECLRRITINQPITLLVFNEAGQLKEFDNRFQIVELGWINDDQRMKEAYNAADIFLMPSVAEAFGMMAMEAMAFSKPVIVMDGTALVDVVKPDEGGGIVVAQGDVDGMSLALQELIDNPSERQRLGERCRLITEKHYSKDRYVHEIIKVYESAINRRKINPRVQTIIERQKLNTPQYEDHNLNQGDNAEPTDKMITNGEYWIIRQVRRLKRNKYSGFFINRIGKPIIHLLIKIKNNLR
jgi:glycosyltransferase involved in cell wall biosynthesis